MHEAKVPSKRLLDSIPEAVPGATDLLIDAAVGQEYTVLGHLALLLGEKLCAVRPLGQEDVGGEGDDDGGDALDEEEPLPGMETCNAVHVFEDAGGEETRYDVGDGVAGVPDGHAEGGFFLGVPR